MKLSIKAPLQAGILFQSPLRRLCCRALPIVVALSAALATAGCGCGGKTTGCGDNPAFVPNYLANFAEPLRWRSFPIRVAFVRNAAYTDVSHQTIVAGFDQWVQATGRVISYTEVGAQDQSDITVELFDAVYLPSGPPGSTVPDSIGGVLRHATVQLATRQHNQATLQEIGAHEFGHALGLHAGHSDVVQDLMFGSPYQGQGQGNPPPPPKPITTRDLNTIKALYCNRFQ